MSFVRNRWIILTCIFGLVVLVVSSVFIWKNSNSKNSSNSTLPSQTEIKQASNFQVGVWSPDWASDSSLTSLKQNGNKLNSFSPVWYEIKDDGTLSDKKPPNANVILEEARNQGLSIMPTVAEFDHDIFSSVLQNPLNFQRHIDSLIKIVDQKNIDGLDLDYESTKLADKDKYFEMLKELSKALKDKGKKLNVTVLAQWGDEVDYKSLKETRKVQDWAEIVKYADTITLMAYDYTGTGAAFPGPIGPLEWQEQVIKYALSKVSSDKIIFGSHLYSYEKYSEASSQFPAGSFNAPSLKFTPNFEDNIGVTTETRSYTYNTVDEILNKYTGQSEEYQGEKIYRYSKQNGDTGKVENRVLVYIDPDGIKERFDLATKYNLRGIEFWRSGSEGNIFSKLPNTI